MEHPILTLTEAAIAKIKSLQESDGRKGMALRATVREDGPAAFKYTLGFVPQSDKTPEDEAVEADGFLVYVDPQSVQRLAGATLDFLDEVDGSGFKFDNPNKSPLLNDPVAARVYQLIEEKINPAIASHGGHVTLLDVVDGKIYLQFGGGRAPPDIRPAAGAGLPGPAHPQREALRRLRRPHRPFLGD